MHDGVLILYSGVDGCRVTQIAPTLFKLMVKTLRHFLGARREQIERAHLMSLPD